MTTKFSQFLLLLLVLAGFELAAQTTKDAVVQLSATIQSSPAQVQLNWEMPSPTAEIQLFRRDKGSGTWYLLIDTASTSASSYTDNTVLSGSVYEYGIVRIIGGVPAFGYISTALESPLVEHRGKILLFVEGALQTPLNDELNRLGRDLAGDGWDVIWHFMPQNVSVGDIKNQIVDDYYADPLATKAVFLLGNLPVPYSGNTAWDAHPEHAGAWPSDTYYGDIDGIWTDNLVNNIAAARNENDNIPGDGRFDQSIVPSTSELAVGRVDFSNLSEASFGTTRVELMRRYLNKDHRWRVKEYTVDNKVLVDDNFGYFNGEAFAANGYRNGNPIVGASNVIDGDFFTDTDNQSFLIGYGCGGGNYQGAGGVGSSANFATDSVNVVFSMLFGSYFGDWDYNPDPFMPAALASKGGILTCSWAGRPHWYMHHMGAGETIGYASIETQNACDNPGYVNYYGTCGTHASLLGDPALRAQIVAPAKDVTAVPQCGLIELNWTASADPLVEGYDVYRSISEFSGYEKISGTLVAGTSYTDESAPDGQLYYQVRAVKLETTPSGTFWNSSTGAFASINYANLPAPVVSASSGTITCVSSTATITASSSQSGLTYTWQTGNGEAIGASIEVDAAGTYTVTGYNPLSGCEGTATATVTVDQVAPVVSATGGSINCTQPATVISASSNVAATYAWEGPGGAVYNVPNPTVSAAGTYTVTVTANNNGCSSTATAEVTANAVPPTVEATGGVLDCSHPTLTLGLTTSATSATYSWKGPANYSSSLKNPTVSIPGSYRVTVTDTETGCSAADTVAVTSNFTLPGATATGAILSCNAQLVQIFANSTTNGVTYAWSGPGGFISTLQNPFTSLSGTYAVTVTGPNGCTSTATALVEDDASLPDVSAVGGLITCYNDTDTLRGYSETSGVTFAWSGPGGFSASTQNTVAAEPGVYLLTVTALNGCSNSTTTIMAVDVTPPNVNAIGGEINCLAKSVQLLATGSGSNFYEWEGPNGFSSFEQNPVVFSTGTYTVVATNPINGCFTIDETTVTQNISEPVANITPSATELNCIVTEITLDPAGSSTGTNFGYKWNETPYNSLTPIIIDFPGDYTLLVTDNNNGCSASMVITITQDIISPQVIATGGTLICADSEVTLVADVSPANSQWAWVGFPAQENPTVNAPGNYTVVAVNPDNGCQSSASVEVDAITPFLSLQPVNITLGCDSIVKQWVNPAGGTPPYSYLWSNGAVTDTAYFSNGETVAVTVSDANGCSVSSTPTVIQIDVLTVGTTKTDASGPNTADGTATAIASGGAAPFTYLWSNGATTAVINNLSPGEYCVTVTSTNGCTAVSCVTVSFEVGSNEPPAGWQVHIAPNPTGGFTWIDMRFAQPENVDVLVYDLTGRLVQHESPGIISEQRMQLDLNNQPSGMYLLRIRTQDKTYTWKVVKE